MYETMFLDGYKNCTMCNKMQTCAEKKKTNIETKKSIENQRKKQKTEEKHIRNSQKNVIKKHIWTEEFFKIFKCFLVDHFLNLRSFFQNRELLCIDYPFYCKNFMIFFILIFFQSHNFYQLKIKEVENSPTLARSLGDARSRSLEETRVRDPGPCSSCRPEPRK